MIKWSHNPAEACQTYIVPIARHNSHWVEDSRDIPGLRINKRELFTLCALAELANQGDGNWQVGYDENDGEPNDGHITDGERKVSIEHKVVAQDEEGEVLDGILDRYAKNAAKGKSYSERRVLVIQPNKSAKNGGMVQISVLTNLIKGRTDACGFLQVLTLNTVSEHNDGTYVLHIVQHHPRPSGPHPPGRFTSQVNFRSDGTFYVASHGIDWVPSKTYMSYPLTS